MPSSAEGSRGLRGPNTTHGCQLPSVWMAEARGVNRERGAGARGHKQQRPQVRAGTGSPPAPQGGRALRATCACHAVHGTCVSPTRVCVWGACVQMHMGGQRAREQVCVVEREAGPVAWGPGTGQGWAGHRAVPRALSLPWLLPLSTLILKARARGTGCPSWRQTGFSLRLPRTAPPLPGHAGLRWQGSQLLSESPAKVTLPGEREAPV